ncbi:hypothetical protein B5P46_32685 [Rhizobium leguminosarum]|uniref:HNH domain-containing protein n=1 Tax=Rhizobium leguminosarum TaxID=384 RepID=A0A4Q1TCR1_RHILE|nr:hypothetical protein B5P46_32685 [Rhizobium leguminosarum]
MTASRYARNRAAAAATASSLWFCDNPPHKQPRNAETLEHLRRHSDGGRNNRDNIALACKRCNEERCGMDWLLYTSYRRGEIWELIECAPPCAHRRGS